MRFVFFLVDLLTTHPFLRDAGRVHGVLRGPLALGDDVGHARFVRLELANAAT